MQIPRELAWEIYHELRQLRLHAKMSCDLFLIMENEKACREYARLDSMCYRLKKAMEESES